MKVVSHVQDLPRMVIYSYGPGSNYRSVSKVNNDNIIESAKNLPVGLHQFHEAVVADPRAAGKAG
jgi:hypothetical protein